MAPELLPTITLSLPVVIFSPADSFVSVWDTTLLSPGSSGSSSISLPLESTGSYNFFVDWGDGDVDFITAFNQPEVTHTYASSGVYTVTINGTLRGFRFNNAGDKNKILDISQWGNMNLGNNARQFIGAENLDISATDAPDLTGITTFSVMFFNTSSLGNVNFSSWDVSAVTVMENMFNSAPNFNGDLSGWDVSNVVDMNQMFYSANSFDGDLSNWDVSNVEDMQRLFSATSFSGNISSWDTSSVTNMFEMFRSVPGFDYDISGWDVDQVTICDDFSLATNVTWNTPEKPLFLNCTPEYFPITAFVSIWDTTQTSTGSSGSNSVELPLGSSGNYNFQVDWGDGTSDIITSYNQGAVQHNYSSPGTYTIIIEGQIQGFRFNNDRDRNKIVDISQWGNLNLGNLGSYFYGAENLDISAIDAPNLTGTTDFRNIFNGANSLTNPDFSKWKTGNVTTLLLGFAGATNFNGNISTWNMSNVIDLTLTFSSASSFDQDLNNWDVSSVENMLSTFFFASNFNGNIGNWDVSRVENMRNTFFSASNFNQDLSGWDTGSVLDMERTFSNANSFNQDLSGWDVDQVTSCFDFNISTSSWVLPKPAFSSC